MPGIKWERQISREPNYWFDFGSPKMAILSAKDWFRYVYKVYFTKVQTMNFTKALEIGPGATGGYLSIMPNIAPKGRYAVEPIADILREKGYLPYGKHIKYTTCYAEKMPYGDESFDLVVLANVLDHVKDVKESLKEINRVLKPQGHIMFFTYLRVKNPHPTTWWTPEEARALFGEYECLESHFMVDEFPLDRPRNPYYVATFRK